MKTSDYDYELPPELIAQTPAPERDAARMLVLHRADGRIEHRIVRELPEYVDPGDVVVVNNTRVVPVRMFGHKEGSGGRVEVFFLEEREDGTWDVLLRSRRRPKPGHRIPLGSGRAFAELLEDLGGGAARMRIESDVPVLELLEAEGRTPLPPYIRRPASAPEPAEDRARYQTVFARQPGAVAAPTAGLHFTPALLAAIRGRGVETVEVTLHVGPGTFRPVTAEDLAGHKMDSERYEITADAAQSINRARAGGRRVLAVGTTSVRALETSVRSDGLVASGVGRSELFIHPPYQFGCIGALLTNFHLPRSTLLMLVSAFAGREAVLDAYATAVREKYRFYSYGDCMLIV